jgi:hypothetical protein
MKYLSYGLIARIRPGSGQLNRTMVQDAPQIREAMTFLRRQVIEVGVGGGSKLGDADLAYFRAALWAYIVGEGMDMPTSKKRDPDTLVRLHAGGMGLLQETGFENVLIIEHKPMVYEFRKIEGTPQHGYDVLESQIRMIAEELSEPPPHTESTGSVS